MIIIPIFFLIVGVILKPDIEDENHANVDCNAKPCYANLICTSRMKYDLSGKKLDKPICNDEFDYKMFLYRVGLIQKANDENFRGAKPPIAIVISRSNCKYCF